MTSCQSRLPLEPAAVNPDDRRAWRELSRLHGREFDRLFAGHMFEDDQQDIARFDKQGAGGDPVTSRLARRILPRLRHHLDLVQALDR